MLCIRPNLISAPASTNDSVPPAPGIDWGLGISPCVISAIIIVWIATERKASLGAPVRVAEVRPARRP